jgi:DNA-binding protein HU-beta
VNKSDLIEVVSQRLGDRRTASTAVEAVVDAITRAVAKGEKVGISGFGVFEPVDRAARTARNPTTGEAVKLKKTRVPKFRPGQGFKDIVSGAKKVDPVSGARAVTARAGVPRTPRTAAAEGTAAAPRATTARATQRPAGTKAAGRVAKAAPAPAATAAKAPSKATTSRATGGRTVAAPGARSAAAAKAPGKTAAAKAPAAKAVKAAKRPAR